MKDLRRLGWRVWLIIVNKCLYDMDKGTDKLILIQAVILLGFWYSDVQDHTGAWYWIGIAISLAQSIGLHRAALSTSRTQVSSPTKASLMRRIWWSCLIRDRWVSFSKGRPMRIHEDDYDTPIPVSADILDELDLVEGRARARFIPRGADALAEMWLRLARISHILGGIIKLHHRSQGPRAQAADVDVFTNGLQALAQNAQPPDGLDDGLTVHAHQIELLYQFVTPKASPAMCAAYG